MIKRSFALLGAVAMAAVSAACGPTDAALDASVKTRLAADETVKVAHIDVAVQKKVVTLTGTVTDPALKARAVVVAQGTDGVTDVVDRITVQNAGPGPGWHHGHDQQRGEGEHRATP